MKLGLIVEGHGEVASVPILIRRLADAVGQACVIRSSLRVPRSTLLKPGELERAVTLIGNKVGEGGAVLVLVDADDDLACVHVPAMLSRAASARPDRRVGVVLAVREYEAWFLAAAATLRGKRGLPEDLEPPPVPEAIRDAKGWLATRMPRGYSPTTDQPALSAVFDVEQARTCRSFDKLVREVVRLLTPEAL